MAEPVPSGPAAHDVDRPVRALRLLMVIEMGGNWGHVLRVRPVALAARARGHQVALATADVATARRMFAGTGVEVLPVPRLGGARRRGASASPRHYAQLLHAEAFGDEAGVDANLRYWDSLLDRVRPDVMVTDFAPFALLVARLRLLRAVSVSMGWETPPADRALPVTRPWEVDDATAFDAVEAGLLARLNRRCRNAGVPLLSRVSDLYSQVPGLLATWPEMDHFGPRSQGEYIGPLYTDDMGVPARWADTSAQAAVPRVLAYLAQDPRNEALVAAFGCLGLEAIVVIPGLADDVAAQWRTPRVQVLAEPLRIADVVPTARLLVTNGGHGMAGAALRAGVPMLLLPRTAEQALASTRLEAAGVGRALVGPGRPFAPEAAVAQALADDTALAAARAAAARHGAVSHDGAVRRVVAVIEAAGSDAPA